jgi:CMP-N-acetylneuraminic acid synthetase
MSGMPLIYWAIKAALESTEFERVIVSTDDSEIATIAIDSGAEAPFTRSAELSDDFASTISVVADAIGQIGSPHEFDLTCCLYPAGIFTTKEDLTEARRLLEVNPGVPYVAPVLRYSHPIQRAFEIGALGKIAFVDPPQSDQRTQDLAPRFHDAGQFYLGRTESWLSGVPILENAIGLELPSWRVLDIDNEDDWIRAQELHRIQLRHHEFPSQAADPQMH